jgi:hypothetical protein
LIKIVCFDKIVNFGKIVKFVEEEGEEDGDLYFLEN